MPIEEIKFGKNLRPSTVDVMNKVNEIINSLNNSSGDEFEELSQRVDSLEQGQQNIATQVMNLNNNYNDLEPRVTQNESDLTDVKITLYTPLSSDEND